MNSRMFSFITKTWNPVCMICKHQCLYCWAEALKKGKLKDSPRYQRLGLIYSSSYLVEKELHRRFNRGDYVFVEDMGDLFGYWIPEPFIYEVMKVIESCPQAKFLLLTKNPWRMLEYRFPENVLCGATIETNRSVRAFSKAPAPQNRYRAMKELQHSHKMICIEPIMDFDFAMFFAWLTNIPNLEMVVIGYDNYNNGLPEPPLAKTMKLINELRQHGMYVVTKTLREKKDV